MSTNIVSAKDIKRDWHLIDAKGKVLGRLATDVAKILMGKNKPNYVSYMDMGDYVVVTNAVEVKVTGKKAEQKKYYTHSMYPGGLKTKKFSEVRPEEIIRHAVSGMLPKNKLRSAMLKKLHVYKDENHPYQKQVGGSK
jgi:large subunit ribosomal protein L13